MRKDGWLIFEFGYGQALAIREIIACASAWHLEKLREDLQGLPRTAVRRQVGQLRAYAPFDFSSR